jgi:hypothetical protein
MLSHSIAPWAGLFAYLALLPVGFAVPSESPRTRCALTAPFHPYPLDCSRKAVSFLLHFPSDCSALMLSSTGPRKAPLSRRFPAVRTFLIPTSWDAIAASAAIVLVYAIGLCSTEPNLPIINNPYPVKDSWSMHLRISHRITWNIH